MSNKLLRLVALSLAAAALIACTRDRETPTPAPTASTPGAAQSITVTGTQGGGADPVVEMTGGVTGGVAAAVSSPQPTAEATLEPAPSATFDYTVKPGDTLAGIATKYETEVQTLRELNFLLDDNIFAGQMLTIPFKEGMTIEGMPAPTPTPFSYVVQQGDTLSSIGLQFGVQPGVLIEVNNILDPNNLTVGTPLLIPGYTAPAVAGTQDTGGETATDGGSGGANAAAGVYVTHIVQPGESLGEIAAEYGVDPVALADANNITNGNLIRVGQQLVIPGITERQALEARGERHIVQSGESLSMIAAQYGVSVQAILAANALDDPNTIKVGQELLIPPAD